jgi:hypothetical protein
MRLLKSDHARLGERTDGLVVPRVWRNAARIRQPQRCACHGERRRRTGHSTWARPTGFAVDSPLEGLDSNFQYAGAVNLIVALFAARERFIACAQWALDDRTVGRAVARC